MAVITLQVAVRETAELFVLTILPMRLSPPIAFIAGALIVFAGQVSADTLRLKGSNTLGARLAPALAEAFLRQRGCGQITRERSAAQSIVIRGDGACAELTVDIDARGTATGFIGLSDKTAELAMASRPINAAELALLPDLANPGMEQVVALDGLAIIVASSSPLRELKLEEVRALFLGEVDSLAKFGGPSGPLKRYVRDDKSGTFDTFKHLVLRDRAIAGTNTLTYESSEQLAAAVARDPNGIGFVGLAAIGAARALKISGTATEALAPNEFSVATEDYLLSRRIYLYHLPDAPKIALDFIAFSRSAAASKIIDSEHFVALNVRQFNPRLPADSPSEYLELTNGLARLSLNFRFADGLSLLDSKSLSDLGRLAAYLQAQPAKTKVVLIGFSDSSESLPYMSLALSTDRVDYVAQRLAGAGVAINKARGLGAAAPLADNQTALGREKNRRVEVWIEVGAARSTATSSSRP